MYEIEFTRGRVWGGGIFLSPFRQMGWLSNSVSYFKQIWSKLSHLEGRPVTAGSVTMPPPAEQPHKREERTGKAERDMGKHNATSWGQGARAGEHSRDQGGSGLGGRGLSSKCPVNPEGRRKTGTIGPRAPSCGRGKHAASQFLETPWRMYLTSTNKSPCFHP